MTDFNTNYLWTTPFSDHSVQVALAATTALPYTIPGTKADLYRCEFKWPYNANVWVGYNSTATVPTPGTITTNPNVSIAFRPSIKFVRGGDVLSFISDALVTNGGFELLKLPS